MSKLFAALIVGVILASAGVMTFPVHAASGIAFVGVGGGVNSGSTITVNYASSAGNTLFVEVGMGFAGNSVSRITDSGGDTFSLIAGHSFGSRDELWGTPVSSSHVSTSFTVTLASGSINSTAIVAEYAGIHMLGSSLVTDGGNRFAAINVTLSSPSDFAICAFASTQNNAFSAGSGNLRLFQPGSLTGFWGASAEVDNTGSSSVTCSGTWNFGNSWAGVAVDVRATSGIAFVGVGGGVNSGSTITVNYASSAGNTLFVIVSMGVGNSVSRITDSGGDTFSLIAGHTLGGRGELWSTAVGSSHVSTSFTVTLATVSNNDTAIVAEYAGIHMLGSSFVSSGNGPRFMSVNATLSSPSDFAICGFAMYENNGFVTGSGNLRLFQLGSPTGYFGSGAAMDNTGSGVVTCSGTENFGNAWNGLAVDAIPFTDYALSNNGPVSIKPGKTGTVTITATLTQGVTESVTLSCTDLPTGITCTSFSVNPVSPTAPSVLTIGVASGVSKGTFTFHITGSPLGVTTAPTTVTVNVT